MAGVKIMLKLWFTTRNTSQHIGAEDTDVCLCKADGKGRERADRIICYGSCCAGGRRELKQLTKGLADINTHTKVRVLIMKGIKSRLKH